MTSYLCGRAWPTLALLLLMGACDSNGPNCDGKGECVLWMAQEEAPCWGYRTIPRESARFVTWDAATWVEEGEDGCYFISHDATDIPSGFAFPPQGHWCHELMFSTGELTTSAEDEDCAAWYEANE